MLAGNMFSWMAYVGIVCAVYILSCKIYQDRWAALNQNSFILASSMLLLVLIGQFGFQTMMAEMKVHVAPLDVMSSPLAAQFKTMHGLASILYLLQSILGILLLTVQFPRKNI